MCTGIEAFRTIPGMENEGLITLGETKLVA